MNNNLDETALTTMALLEARLLRIDHLLYGSSAPPYRPPTETTLDSLAKLENRFAIVLRRFRVYAELLKIYAAHPSLFQSPSPDAPPTELSPEALRATVLSYAASFPSTASALTAVTSDTPVPDAKRSADLASLMPRMKGVEAMQLAQEAEIAELRTRSECVLRRWYEGRMLRYSQFVADIEGRIEEVEMGVRRAERLLQTEKTTL
ncbi:nuclear distribution protein [Diplogelasinospora grovesii]|uniref:Nuclear distribution protein n=1 Tax=Diplogelasinospora grovesii TaxID=303347 RepID=A0AAN6RZW7_9PEZI|nr:nuclear distribution protein [Diplogelasinospora grovesii]